MIYKCCEYLLHQIVFDQDLIRPCCGTSMNETSAEFIKNFDGTNFDINKYIENRNQYIEMFKSGKIPKCCKDCPMIKEADWDDESIYFDRIIMANITKCSCKCIYCVYNDEDNDKPEEKETYDIKPILTDLRNNNYIKDNLIFIIGGGECTEYPKGELEWLIYFTSFHNGKIQLLSSGIKYSKAIEQILKISEAELIISPDSGKKKTYEKIKRVKAFDRVWNNLKQYIETTKENKKKLIEIKYIIIPSVNDNISEIKAFLKKCREINCKKIHVDIEHSWFIKNKKRPMPNKIKKLINYFNLQRDMSVAYSVETKEWLNNHGECI